MPVFKDELGREWDVTLNHAAVVAAKSRLKTAGGEPVNLYKLLDNDAALFREILGDLFLLVDLLFVVARPVKGDKVQDFEFAQGLAGDAFDRAETALLEAVKDFFPDPRRRAVLEKLIRRVRETGDKAIGKATAKMQASLDAFDPEKEADKLIRRLEESQATNGNGSPTSGPASSDSTPALSASATST